MFFLVQYYGDKKNGKLNKNNSKKKTKNKKTQNKKTIIIKKHKWFLLNIKGSWGVRRRDGQKHNTLPKMQGVCRRRNVTTQRGFREKEGDGGRGTIN